MDLLKLPDEILLMIFENVSSNDLLSLARTCRTLASLTCDRRLVSTLDFHYETSLHCDLLKSFLTYTVRTNEVSTIDLTSCHWLSSSFLLNVLMRLRNVENILVADTTLSFTHLKRVLSNLTRVKRLSWSWKKGANTTGLQSALRNLTFLYLYFHDEESIIEMCTSSFVDCCENLTELWVVCTPHQREIPAMVLKKKVPHLKKLVVCHTNIVNIQSNNVLTHAWSPHMKFAKDMMNAEVLLTKTWDEAKSICAANVGTIKRLSIMEPIHGRDYEIFFGQMEALTALHVTVPEEFSETIFAVIPQLEELSVLSDPGQAGCSTKFCKSVSFCSYVKRLVLPVGALVCDKSNTPCSTPKARVSRVVGPAPENVVTPFKKMVCSTPLVEEFEVGTVPGNVPVPPAPLQWDFHSLRHIVEWKKLSSLTLANLPIVDGKLFAPILVGCKLLKELKILNLGPRGRCIYANDLYSALKYSKCLKDFEWEQAHVGNTSRLWNSLSEVNSLERLSIRNTGVSDIYEQGIMSLLEKCHGVTFLFILTGATQARCISLKRKIAERWGKLRAALIVQCVSSAPVNWTEKLPYIPAVHKAEMWTLKSRITHLPTSSSSVLSFRFCHPVSWAPHV